MESTESGALLSGSEGSTFQCEACNLQFRTINGSTESANCTYDLQRRLVTSSQTSNGSSAQRAAPFYYDRWGNRTTTYQYLTQIQSINLQTVSFPGTGTAPTKRITSVTSGGTLSYTYDANGNGTNDGSHSYTYDSENRLVNVDNGAAVYAYDHQNRRYKKTNGSSVTHYVWEGGQVVGEYNGSTGAMLVQYGYAGSRMIAKTAGGVTQYFLSDRLSMRLTLSDVGVVTGRQAHIPFGEDFGGSGTQEKHHFTSYERDSESSTDYAVNRQYSQSVGRFARVDPKAGSLSNPQSLDRYSYVTNDPIQLTDPSGLDSFSGPGSGTGFGWPWEADWFYNWSGVFPGPNINNGPPSEGPTVPVFTGPFPFDLSPGSLFVGSSCDDRVVVIPSNAENKEYEERFIQGTPGQRYYADFVLTPRGALKISDFCACVIDCDDNYRVKCSCLKGFGILSIGLFEQTSDQLNTAIGKGASTRYSWFPPTNGYGVTSTTGSVPVPVPVGGLPDWWPIVDLPLLNNFDSN